MASPSRSPVDRLLYTRAQLLEAFGIAALIVLLACNTLLGAVLVLRHTASCATPARSAHSDFLVG
jgi:hypothetical protein